MGEPRVISIPHSGLGSFGESLFRVNISEVASRGHDSFYSSRACCTFSVRVSFAGLVLQRSVGNSPIPSISAVYGPPC